MAIKVIKNEMNPETPEVLASSIITIADGFLKLREVFTEDGIVSLIDALPGCNVGKNAIRTVLRSIPTLKGYYLRK